MIMMMSASDLRNQPLSNIWDLEMKPTTMEEYSNVDFKPDIKYFARDENADVQTIKLENEDLSSNTPEVQCCKSKENEWTLNPKSSCTKKDSNFPVKPDIVTFCKEEKPDVQSFYSQIKTPYLNLDEVQGPNIMLFEEEEELDTKNVSSIGNKNVDVTAIEDTESEQGDFQHMTEEKPCIAALRAAVEAYSANGSGDKDTGMETSNEVEISSYMRLDTKDSQDLRNQPLSNIWTLEMHPTTMDEYSNVDFKPDVKYFAWDEKADVQTIKLENKDLSSTTSEVQCCISEENEWTLNPKSSCTEKDSNFPVKPDIVTFCKEEKPDVQSFYSEIKTPLLNLDEVQGPKIMLSEEEEELDTKNVSSIGNKNVAVTATEDTESEQGDFQNMTEEKPCIAALRAAVEAYSAKESGEKDTRIETSDEVEISSHERLDTKDSQGDEHFESEKTTQATMNHVKLTRKNMEIESSMKDTEILSLGGENNIPPESCSSRSSFKSEYLKLLDQKGCQVVESYQKTLCSKERSYKCDMCGKCFSTYCSLSGHTRRHVRDKLHQCDVCAKRYFTKSRLGDHKRIHFKERPYECVVCGKSFKTKGTLRQHKLIHLQENFHCDFCDKSFRTKKFLHNHKKEHFEEKRFKCDLCGKSFRRNYYLSQHKATHSNLKPYKCDVCGKSFKTKSNLTLHKTTHSKLKPYRCDICDRTFKTSGVLHAHTKTHLTERQHSCDLCGKRFKRKYALKEHKEIHLKEKPYGCDVCEKRFKTNRALGSHRKIHFIKEWLYRCDACGKNFKTNKNLQRHTRTHSDERPYNCYICNKSFKLKNHFNAHQRSRKHAKKVFLSLQYEDMTAQSETSI